MRKTLFEQRLKDDMKGKSTKVWFDVGFEVEDVFGTKSTFTMRSIPYTVNTEDQVESVLSNMSLEIQVVF